jgi:hypothetical protein
MPGTPDRAAAKARYQSEQAAGAALHDLAKIKTGVHGSVLKQLAERIYDQAHYEHLVDKHPKLVSAGLRHAAKTLRDAKVLFNAEHHADVAQHLETSADEIDAVAAPAKAVKRKHADSAAGIKILSDMMSAIDTDILGTDEYDEPDEAESNGVIRSAISGERLIIPDDAGDRAKLTSALLGLVGRFGDLADDAKHADERRVYSKAAEQCGDMVRKIANGIAKAGFHRIPSSTHRVEVQPPTRKRAKFPFVGFIEYQGIKIDVENKKGDVRTGVDSDGKSWRNVMRAHYGEARHGVNGADGDKVDVYVGPSADSPLVVVVHQNHPDTGEYDEDKVMLGFDTVTDAVACYRKQYDRPGFYRDHTVMPIGQFKRWLDNDENDGKRIAKACFVSSLLKVWRS